MFVLKCGELCHKLSYVVIHVRLFETIEKFDKMNLNHGELNYKKFWLALIRGGIQGALYVSK